MTLGYPFGRLRAGLMVLGEAVLGFVYPPVCILCGRLQENNRFVCENCWKALPSSLEGNLPFDIGSEQVSRGAVVRYAFSPEVRELIHRLKYDRRTDLAKALGDELARQIAGHPAFRQVDALVPVPLHPARLRERGFNQSELIAHPLAEAMGVEVESEFLRRVRATKSQTNLSPEERRANVAGAFRVPRPQDVKGKALVLVDDVIVTGSTINACAEALIEAGARRVLAAALARP